MADYLKLPELARRLDVSQPTARRMVRSGKLPSVFVGGAYRVNEDDLEKYLEDAKVRPGDSPKAQAPLSEGTGRREALRQNIDKRNENRTLLSPEEQRAGRLRGYAATAEQVSETCSYWESRLDNSAGLDNTEIQSLASFMKSQSNLLEGETNAELRDLQEQHPDETQDDLRYRRSVLEPVRHRWVGIIIRAARLELFRHTDPDTRRMVREAKEEIEVLEAERMVDREQRLSPDNA